MRIIIQSDTGATLDTVHVPDEDLDDCTAMMNLESRMMDARQGFRNWCLAVYPTGVVRVDKWLREQRDKAGSRGFVVAPVEVETECEICGDATKEEKYCGGCYDRIRKEELEVEEIEETGESYL